MESQKDIFHLMLQGDEEALKLLLGQYHNYLVVVGLRYLSDRQRVEDVIHDVFADLWNSKKKIEISHGTKSFLRGAVVNKCLAIVRKESRISLVENHSYELTDTKASADQLMDRDLLKKAIDDVVDTLPEKCRKVFLLSRVEGKSHREISEELDISKKTIENHMTKALRTIRAELQRKELLISIFILMYLSIRIGGSIVL